jgi:hypothetical protein
MTNTRKKKNEQLGMDSGTASYRLVKDLLFNYIYDAGIVCYRCGGELSREDFSIEHKECWLDSDDPVGLFFDLKNIAYSHKSCNYKAKRKRQPIYSIEEIKKRDKESRKRHWTPEKRREHYLRTGN